MSIFVLRSLREIEFVESLPKTISGKMRHIELRAREQQKKLTKECSCSSYVEW